jgi:hypothetical protein
MGGADPILRLGLPEAAGEHADGDRYAIAGRPGDAVRHYLCWRDAGYVIDVYRDTDHVESRPLRSADAAYAAALTIAGLFVDVNDLPSNRGADATWRTYPGHFEANH